MNSPLNHFWKLAEASGIQLEKDEQRTDYSNNVVENDCAPGLGRIALDLVLKSHFYSCTVLKYLFYRAIDKFMTAAVIATTFISFQEE